ncbi:hypothetical protein SHDE107825_00835 [Shewanella denitrificans]
MQKKREPKLPFWFSHSQLQLGLQADLFGISPENGRECWQDNYRAQHIH